MLLHIQKRLCFDNGDSRKFCFRLIVLIDFVSENSILKMNRAVVFQPLKRSMKFFKKSRQTNNKKVLNLLRKTRYQKKLDTRVTHELTSKNLMNRISICECLLERNEIDKLLKQRITGDEKQIMSTYVKLALIPELLNFGEKFGFQITGLK